MNEFAFSNGQACCLYWIYLDHLGQQELIDKGESEIVFPAVPEKGLPEERIERLVETPLVHVHRCVQGAMGAPNVMIGLWLADLVMQGLLEVRECRCPTKYCGSKFVALTERGRELYESTDLQRVEEALGMEMRTTAAYTAVGAATTEFLKRNLLTPRPEDIGRAAKLYMEHDGQIPEEFWGTVGDAFLPEDRVNLEAEAIQETARRVEMDRLREALDGDAAEFWDAMGT